MRADVDPQVLDSFGSIVCRAAAPEVRAFHCEHPGNESLDVATMPNDVNPLTFMELIPERAAPAIARWMNPQVALLGDLADGIADLVDAARQNAAR
jgi:hypothetical protein